MFGAGPPPVMRGDLFSLLDADGGRVSRAVVLDGIAQAAGALVDQVQRGARARGSAVVMQCLEELATLEREAPLRAYATLTSVRQRLRSLGLARGRRLPGELVGERTLVLPQTAQAAVLRVLPAQEHQAWYVVTREGAVLRDDGLDEAEVDPFEALARPRLADMALGPPRYERPEVTFRLYRFGENPADIRLCMRVVQEPGSFCEVHACGDGERVAMLSKDVIGVFEGDGRPVLSGRLPLGKAGAVDESAVVTGLALDGDVLGLNVKHGPERPAELALLSVSERRGFPVGTVGEEAEALALGPRQAYVIDGLLVVRLPLAGDGVEPATFQYRPWFGEFAWSAHHQLRWDGERVWLSNGHKLVVVSEGLDRVLAEIILPEPVIDFAVSGDEVRLVHHDARAGRLRVAHWVLADEVG